MRFPAAQPLEPSLLPSVPPRGPPPGDRAVGFCDYIPSSVTARILLVLIKVRQTPTWAGLRRRLCRL